MESIDNMTMGVNRRNIMVHKYLAQSKGGIHPEQHEVGNKMIKWARGL